MGPGMARGRFPSLLETAALTGSRAVGSPPGRTRTVWALSKSRMLALGISGRRPTYSTSSSPRCSAIRWTVLADTLRYRPVSA